MRRTKWWAVPAAFGLMMGVAGLAAAADTKVEIKGVHLCCGACVKGVATALKGMEGVTPACDKDAGKVTITASSDAAAQTALDALARAGYFGDTKNTKLAMKAPSVPKGKVKSLSLSGVHNCCGSCCRAIKAAIKTVDGVTGDTATPKKDSFEVTGDFEPSALLDALNAAGFNATVK